MYCPVFTSILGEGYETDWKPSDNAPISEQRDGGSWEYRIPAGKNYTTL